MAEVVHQKAPAETHGGRQKATNVLRDKAEALRRASVAAQREAETLARKACRLEALAGQVDAIEAAARAGVPDGVEGPIPYIGVGSDAEQALWEMALDVDTGD
jgi:hypothetical protein